jgi:hypothetical protein
MLVSYEAANTDIIIIIITIVIRNAPAIRSRDIIVDIAIGYGIGDRGVGVRVPVGSRIFSSPCRPDSLWGPPNLLSGSWSWTPPPASAEVKKMLIYTSTPPYAFMA